MKQTSSIHEYVVKLQDLHSKTKLTIADRDPRFYFRHGICAETMGSPPRTQGQKNTPRQNQDASQFLGKSWKRTMGKNNVQNSPSSGNDDWKKHETCHTCKKKDTPSACIQPAGKEEERVDIHRQRLKSEWHLRTTSRRLESQCARSGDRYDGVRSWLRPDGHLPRRSAELILEVPDFRQGSRQPEIDLKTLRLSPRLEAVPEEPLRLRNLTVNHVRVAANRRLARVNQSREIYNFYRHRGYNGDFGQTSSSPLRN
ncbi:hypothetical protein PsorP6_005161 [Peronosclerospora sorghi]|uniref:Uncharacterized protein n=1 Tax=Peronosclerospora sorghi TaxID=230839 RepID=A0ACC0W4S4_9STRA|nr:hypothetical protein PsorP6_005161 [Peronosclerospora sorghi]